jgi:FMN phosphatase YigB (HAD superfamily)
MLDWSRELRAGGYRTAILSNMSPDRLSFMKGSGRFTWLAEFDVTIYSFHLGCVKPEPEIYRACLRELGLPPAATLFLDDFAENVAAARAMGMNAHLFSTAEEAAAELRSRWDMPVRSLADAT